MLPCACIHERVAAMHPRTLNAPAAGWPPPPTTAAGVGTPSMFLGMCNGCVKVCAMFLLLLVVVLLVHTHSVQQHISMLLADPTCENLCGLELGVGGMPPCRHQGEERCEQESARSHWDAAIAPSSRVLWLRLTGHCYNLQGPQTAWRPLKMFIE